MKKILLLLIFTLMLSGCGVANSYQHLTPSEAAEIIQKDKSALILDVRTLEEYEKKHIPNSVLLPLDEIKKKNFSSLKDKDQKILIYCWTGRRAENAAAILVENGYTNVYEFGGLVEWTGALEGNEITN